MLSVTGGTRRQCLLIVLSLGMALLPFPILAETRIALVISNASYPSEIGKLENPLSTRAGRAWTSAGSRFRVSPRQSAEARPSGLIHDAMLGFGARRLELPFPICWLFPSIWHGASQ
jgi:hypothetical protein